MEAKASLHSRLPAHPDHIYPDWKPNDRAMECYEYSFDGPQLIDEYTGQGLLSSYCGRDSMPDEAEHFVREQFARFGVEQPPDSLLYYCWWQTYYYVDAIDPYVFFYGCTDVIKTEEVYFFQYAVCNDNFQDWTEIEPGNAETFRYWPEGIKSWEILMDYPGLEEFFDGFADYFGEHFDWVCEDSHPECYEDEWEFIRMWGKKGAYDRTHLGLWASIMWMMSPMAKKWRADKHPVFDICYEHGECLVHEWCFHSPEYFRVTDRPAMTCSCCGVSEWCVELTQMPDKETRFICEQCLNPVRQEGKTCGNRLCTKTSCPHNPGANMARRLAADARFGELRQLPNGQKIRELPGMMYINEKMIDNYACGIADAVGNDLKKLLTF